MDLLTLEGIYENGKIELTRQPIGVKTARVKVTFLKIEDVKTDEREAARQRAFARMREGIDFGGEKFDRTELYEERLRELEARQDKSG
jgi:hypothetical protein